ncbi:hypothetical protein GCM10022381_13830 [Leifsonia kafniensis]|uniref:Uncharacterized protein n=1 Tax=Leifsonia kafniensis TaxID=475957 RepID=A0ABP7KBL4_9MICO
MRARAGLLLIASVLVVSGCASAPAPVPSETPTAAAPVFASDEEALAAATEAYAAYQVMIDQALAADEIDTTRFGDVLTGDALRSELETADMYTTRGYRSIGTSKFDSLRIQSIDLNSRVPGMSTYLCSDVSDVDVVNYKGESVVPTTRADRFPIVVEFLPSDPTSKRLLVSSSESWAGKNFC